MTYFFIIYFIGRLYLVYMVFVLPHPEKFTLLGYLCSISGNPSVSAVLSVTCILELLWAKGVRQSLVISHKGVKNCIWQC